MKTKVRLIWKNSQLNFLSEASTRLMEFESGNVDILGNGCVFAQGIRSYFGR